MGIRIVRPLPLIAGTLVLACSDAVAPSPRFDLQSQINILHLAPTAPPLLATSTTFRACQGSGAEGHLVFTNGTGGEGEEFVRLTLDNNTLLAKPDGTPFAPNECIEITITIDDPTQVVVRFEPAGLTFNPADPAQLTIHYGEAEGVDATVESHLAIWRQESAGVPFAEMGSQVLQGRKEVEASLPGFSRYALAY